MKTHTKNYAFEKYGPEQQGTGAFDGGKITEIKPIPFPQEIGGSKRVGPLLYWAWASAKGDGIIGLHPHKGFEIVSYVLEGAIGHTDTAGNNRRVNAGGAQIMQTGSGISHREEMYGGRTDFFQVWFEPNLSNALRKEPRYFDFESKDFPIDALEDSTKLKRIIGKRAPSQLDAPIEWDEILFDEGGKFTVHLAPNSLAAMVQISGNSNVAIGEDEKSLNARDFALVKTTNSEELTFIGQAHGTRIALITAPLDPGYPISRF